MATHGDEQHPDEYGEQPTAVIETDASGLQPTEVIEPYRAEPVAQRRKLGRAARIWIIVGVVLAVLVALVVAADVIARNVAEQRVADEIEANLPDGVDGRVDVTIGGFSVIAQYLTGSMDHVELSAPELVAHGVPVDVHVVLEGVPVDLASPVATADATVVADESAVNQVVATAGVDGGVSLGDGAVAYDRSVEVFGIPIGLTVTATPIAAGDTVLLQSVGVELAAGGGSVDVSKIVDRLMGGDPVEVCVADYLPAGVEVNGIDVTKGSVRITAEAHDLRLDESALATTGSCD